MGAKVIEGCGYGYLGAAILVFASYSVAVSFREIRKSIFVLGAFTVVITAHHVVSMYNFYYWPLRGADLDAFTFHVNARNQVLSGGRPVFSIGTGSYEIILYSAYRFLGSCLLVGQSLSVLIAAVSCVIVARIAGLLNITEPKLVGAIVMITGLGPAFLYYTSLTLREPFQILGLLVGLYYSIVGIRNPSWGKFAAASGGYLFMGLFHHFLLGVAFLLICMHFTVVCYQKAANGRRYLYKLATGVFVIIGLGYWTVNNVPVSTSNDYIKMLRESGGIIEMVEHYRTSVDSSNPRSTYGFKVDTSNVLLFVYGLIRSYASYLFGPGLGSVRSDIDLVAFGDAVIRIVGVVAFMVLVVMKKTTQGLRYLFVVYVMVTLLWSLGTTNYGQAFRHNAITDWIAVIVSVFAAREAMARFILRRA